MLSGRRSIANNRVLHNRAPLAVGVLAAVGALVAGLLAAAPPVAADSGTVTTSYSCAPDGTFTVPDGVASLAFTVAGAAGGSPVYGVGHGGLGDVFSTTLAAGPGTDLPAGTVLTVRVGCPGRPFVPGQYAGGYPDGANGGQGSYSSDSLRHDGAGGGGSSQVRTPSTVLLVAGGGGGDGGYGQGGPGSNPGGAGGYAPGRPGQTGSFGGGGLGGGLVGCRLTLDGQSGFIGAGGGGGGFPNPSFGGCSPPDPLGAGGGMGGVSFYGGASITQLPPGTDGYVTISYAPPGPLDHLVLAPATSTITAGASQAYTAQGADASGNSLGDVTGASTFSIAPDGSCAGASCTATTAGPHTVTATDGGKTGTAALNVNPATAASLLVSGISSPTTAGTPSDVSVTAKDGYGNTATGYAGTVHFTSSDAAAVLPADYTFTASDAATHTFASLVTLKTVGTQSVTATDTVTSTVTGTQSNITVNPATASHLAVSAPVSAAAGTAFTFTVTAKDPFNNTVTGYEGAAHFTSTDGAASLPANSTLTSGVGSFSATLRTPGPQTITATDAASSSITGTSNAIAVTAPPDAALTITHIGATANSHGDAAAGVTFTDADPQGHLSQYNGTIDWGDHSLATSAFFVNNPFGGFAAGGLHHYATRGTYTVTITIRDIGGATATKLTTVVVPPPSRE